MTGKLDEIYENLRQDTA